MSLSFLYLRLYRQYQLRVRDRSDRAIARVWSDSGRRERSGLTDSPTPTGGTPKLLMRKNHYTFRPFQSVFVIKKLPNPTDAM